MKTLFLAPVRVCLTFALAGLLSLSALAQQSAPVATEIPLTELNQQLQVGDLVFIRIGALPFKKVAQATRSWTNHVGVVVDVSGDEAVIAESTIPLSRNTSLSRFAGRSESRRIAVARLQTPLNAQQQAALRAATEKRLGIAYDTGFDLHSARMFCSKFAREVVREASGVELGEVETLHILFAANPAVDLAFWRSWFLGSIPWQRETVTPASMFNSPGLQRVFDGHVSQG